MLSQANNHFDIAVVGGGMAGVTAALCYAQLGLSVALIEAIKPDLPASPSFDQRSVALSASSIAIYQSLGLWSKLAPLACPIESIHVSDAGHSGFVRLNANEHGVDALGKVIMLDQAGPLLWDLAEAESLITAYCPAKVIACQQSAKFCQLDLQVKPAVGDNQERLSITANLVLAADGTFSTMAKLNQLPLERQAYRQHALVANIETQKYHQNRAYERFTKNGPLALLPLEGNRLSMVWCQSSEQLELLKKATADELKKALQKAFGYRLGRIENIGQCAFYPLNLHLSRRQFQGRVLLLGNAAHTLHPIAGQGFNLGLRDIAALNDLLLAAIKNHDDIGCESLLSQFVEQRQADWQQTILATDGLSRLFSNEFFPLKLIRNKLMNTISLFAAPKSYLASAAMGFGLKSSRLARGLVNPANLTSPKTSSSQKDYETSHEK